MRLYTLAIRSNPTHELINHTNQTNIKIVLRNNHGKFSFFASEGATLLISNAKAALPGCFLSLCVVAFSFLCGSVNAAGAGSALASTENQGNPRNPVGKVFDADSKALLRDTAWWGVAEQRGLNPYILYAVALVESAKVSKRMARPWPWALNRQGRPFIPSSLSEAKVILGGSLAKGVRSVDVGLMQVKVRWQGHRVGQPEDLLDPETNLRVGADVLAEAVASAPGNLVLGIGRYHAGFRDADRAYRYGRRELAVARQIRWLI